jgi:xanthine dehydrogenase YagT iron-sulfur-binding subunit
MRVGLSVNGARYDLEVAAERTLAEVLRNELALTGTKVACGEGTCGSCTVVLDSRPTLACLTLAAACEGVEVHTVEGGGELLERLQRAFTDEDAFQCGYCTPGQLMSAVALLQRTPRPSGEEIREALAGNLCRCGAYQHIERAVYRAAAG